MQLTNDNFHEIDLLRLTTSANTTLLLTGDTERDQRIKFCLFSLPSLPTELADGLGLRGALLELLAFVWRLKGT